LAIRLLHMTIRVYKKEIPCTHEARHSHFN